MGDKEPENSVKLHTCIVCGKSYKFEGFFKRHMNTVHGRKEKNETTYDCDICKKSFRHIRNRNRHKRTVHKNLVLTEKCPLCPASFLNREEFLSHLDKRHFKPMVWKYSEKLTAHNGVCKQFRKVYPPESDLATIEELFSKEQENLFQLIMYERAKSRPTIKVSVILQVLLIQRDGEGTIIDTSSAYFRTSLIEVNTIEDVRNFVSNARADIIRQCDEYLALGSGWVLEAMQCLDVDIAKCKSLLGHSNKLATRVKRRKDLNKLFDEKLLSGNGESTNDCFLWAIAEYFKDNHNVIPEEFISKHVIIDETQLPMKVKDIQKFCDNNKHLSIAINVIYVDSEKNLSPLFVSKNVEAKNVINLALCYITKPNGKVNETTKKICEDDVFSHYMYIEDLNLFTKKNTKYGDYWYSEKTEACPNCLHKFRFTSDMARKSHMEMCFRNDPQSVSVPPPGTKIFFKNFEKMLPAPLVAFYDFEAILQKTQDAGGENDVSNFKKATTEVHKHIPICYSLIIVDETPNIVFQKSYSGLDCVENFISTLLNLDEVFTSEPSLASSYPIDMSEEQEQEFKKATKCYLCGSGFLENMDNIETTYIANKKVRDHDHRKEANNFLGAAHSR